jgi:hypothetical protein
MSAPYPGLPGLAAVLRSRGWTLRRLALLLDRDPDALSAVARGRRVCPPQLADLLCRTLGCGLSDLQPFYLPTGTGGSSPTKGEPAAPPAP